jgi:hypothetical protein
LLSVSRPRLRPALPSIARTILASVLILVWLAGVVPFSTLASKHECGMACCIGKPSHLAGSCSTAFGDEEPPEPSAEPESTEPEMEEAEHSDHMMHEAVAASEIHATAGHHETAKQHSAHHSTSGVESRRKVYAASQAVMSTPCSAECAAAIYGSSQVRRPRDPASLTITTSPRPRTDSLVVCALAKPLIEANGHRGPARPRAPPFHTFNLSA